MRDDECRAVGQNNLGHKLRFPESKVTTALDLRGLTWEQLTKMRDELTSKCIQIEAQRSVREARVAAGIEPLNSDWYQRSFRALQISREQIRQIDAARGLDTIRHAVEELLAEARSCDPKVVKHATIETCDFILRTLSKMEV